MANPNARQKALRAQTSDLLPWEQMQTETAPAFEVFAIYRDMGPDRSIRKAAGNVPSNLTQCYAWAKEWNWTPRVLAYDRDQDRLWRAQQEKARKDMATRHANIASAMLMKVAGRLQSLDPEELNPRELAVWVDVAVKVERISRGESDLTVKVQEGVLPDVEKMTPEERKEALMQAVKEANTRLLNPELLSS